MTCQYNVMESGVLLCVVRFVFILQQSYYNVPEPFTRGPSGVIIEPRLNACGGEFCAYPFLSTCYLSNREAQNLSLQTFLSKGKAYLQTIEAFAS